MSQEKENKKSARRKKAWTFLRIFRWCINGAFMAMVGFMAVCAFIGIVANINERYPELELPPSSKGNSDKLTTMELKNCQDALGRMYQEDVTHAQEVFTGGLDRVAFLKGYKSWDKDWRQRFEKLGISCRLTGYQSGGDPTLSSLAEIYRRLDDLHKYHRRTTRRYVTENARILNDIQQLFGRTHEQINQASGALTD